MRHHFQMNDNSPLNLTKEATGIVDLRLHTIFVCFALSVYILTLPVGVYICINRRYTASLSPIIRLHIFGVISSLVGHIIGVGTNVKFALNAGIFSTIAA